MGATLTVMFAAIFTLLTAAFLAACGMGAYSLITEGMGNHDADATWLYSPPSGVVFGCVVASILGAFGLACAGFAYVLWYAFLNRY